MHSIPRVIVVERMEISHRVAIIVICVDSQRLKKCIHTIEKKTDTLDCQLNLFYAKQNISEQYLRKLGGL